MQRLLPLNAEVRMDMSTNLRLVCNTLRHSIFPPRNLDNPRFPLKDKFVSVDQSANHSGKGSAQEYVLGTGGLKMESKLSEGV